MSMIESSINGAGFFKSITLSLVVICVFFHFHERKIGFKYFKGFKEIPMKDFFSIRIRVRWTHILTVIILMMCISALGPWVSDCRSETKKPANDNLPDFTKFSIEELKNVEIISVSKKPEKIGFFEDQR